MSNRILSFFLALLCLPVLSFSQNGIIKGRITDAFSNEPVPFANVVVVEAGKGAVSDEEGNYTITGLEPGLYDVSASYVGYREQTVYEIQVTNSRPAEVNFELQSATEEIEAVTIQASPFRKTLESPVSLRTIGVAEIQRNPGANRDISRVIQSLPGVTTTASFRNDLIIRGGAPNENRFFLDDVEVPNINHFATQGASGGPVGLINVNFINEVEFYSGAFPANRGNALSSVLSFRQRDGRDDRLGATFMAGSSDVGLTLEGPIGDKTTFLLSARRSYLQLLFSALELPFLPTYNDFQAKVKYRIDQKNELTFIGLGAIDDFALNLDADNTEDQRFILENIPTNTQWNYTNGVVYKRYGDQGYWTLVLSRNMLNNESVKYRDNDESSEDNLILRYRSQEIENKFRLERTQRQNGYKLNFGLGYQYVKYNNRTFNRIFTAAGPQTVDFTSDLTLGRYALFAQLSKKYLGDRLSLSLGFRMDGNSYSEEMRNPLEQFSPRFSASYALSERFALNFNTGIYYQLPPYTVLGYQEEGVLVNRDINRIRYIQNQHLVAGLEFNTAANSRITLEGYYKKYDDYPFLVRDQVSLANLGGDFGVIGNEPVVPESEGRSYGLEFLFQQRLYKGFYGIAAYTLGWSEFTDAEGNYAPSSWDSRHIVSLTLGKKLKKDWEIGVNWRFQSGLPFTPFAENSALVASWDVNQRGIPDYSRLNSQRLNAANAIDFRIDKRWYFDKWSLNLYFDVENVTGNAVNIPNLILDRPLDEDGRPIGSGVVVNPDAPRAEQRYAVKPIEDATGQLLPSIGIMIEL